MLKDPERARAPDACCGAVMRPGEAQDDRGGRGLSYLAEDDAGISPDKRLLSMVLSFFAFSGKYLSIVL